VFRLRVQFFFIISLICILSSFAEAKDISTLQTALTLAREDMEKAKDKHEANAQAVAQQQKIVEQRKKQLADESSQLDKMQKDTKQALAQYLEAQQKYKKAQANLDEAWGTK
jgi:hypothetical protein